MLGAIGAGAVLGAFLLGPLRRLAGGGDALVLLGTAGIALAGASLALLPLPALGVAPCFVLGIGWIMVLTTLNVAAQSSLPDWVRGRGLALYIAIQSGAMAGGSLVWGGAAQLGIPAALLGAALLGLLAGILGRRVPLPKGGEDLTPGEHMPAHAAPEAATPPHAGPRAGRGGVGGGARGPRRLPRRARPAGRDPPARRRAMLVAPRRAGRALPRRRGLPRARLGGA
jgi:MFS family permease